MNRSLKLSMLMALALGSSQAMALDLGQIQVKSALGQPLLAEIPLHPANPAELQNLTVQLASSEEFARAGVAGGRTTIPLNFSVTHAGNGQPVIRITSSAPVDDPFLDLLLEVNGKAGKSVREYAILLDPPNATAATAAAAPAPVPATASRPAAKAPARAAAPAAPVAAAPAKAVPRPRPTPAAPAPTASTAGKGQVGPVERGQTLSGIARNVAPSGIDVQQMMLALQQANPNAFYRNNINALKSGVVLRVPTSAEAQAMTIAAAVAEVRRQNSDWRAGTPGKPAVVANAATRTSDAGAPAGTPGAGDRLTLVTAKSGSGTGAQGGGTAGSHQELLRTKESLASLQQQSADLKARLKDLTDINSKNERLLSLKDSEIAELQAKLAAARKSAGTPAAAVPAPAVAAAKTAAASPAATLETAVATAGTATSAHAASTPAAAGSAPHAASPAMTSSVVTTPLATPAPAKPVEKAAARQQPHAPVVVEEPWYMQTWAQAAGAAAVVMLILLALLGRRRRKPADATAASKSAASLADRFGSTPGGAEAHLPGDDVDQEELLDQLAEHPDDIGLHLELVTLYYSRRDVEHFEAAAEAMYAHITDPQQDEWQDVLHMGEDLVPGHPLFDHHAVPAAHEDAHTLGEFDIDDYARESDASTVVSSVPPPLPVGGAKKVSEYNFNFDLTRATTEASARPGTDDAKVAAPPGREPAPAPAPAPEKAASSWHFDDADDAHLANVPVHELGEFSDDPVDTKLDLARAYIDMGDAEGARAMLDEVVKEGSQMQKDVARRLLDGMH
ncbi:fimbrial protein FimV [Rhodanobacter denitrificans]|uniref:Fimbrial protein FimV n=1 Tax=Rhodanobacter denitrificans TaxID=666685 RepID=A0A368KDH8_9GAMM|nr:FimV/HubP family polar landmark protein [Rhodanobacter denitrificans]RCS29969.1 fimbrial protein FimV [Rhodanobacter denitrificans]